MVLYKLHRRASGVRVNERACASSRALARLPVFVVRAIAVSDARLTLIRAHTHTHSSVIQSARLSTSVTPRVVDAKSADRGDEEEATSKSSAAGGGRGKEWPEPRA